MNRQNKRTAKSEGQAILIIALMMVVLLGFTGLAIDGGQVFFAQRNARNAADAAMLAATFELCRTGDPYDATWADVAQAGWDAADANGYSNHDDTPAVVESTGNLVSIRGGLDDNNGATIASSEVTALSTSAQDEYIEVEIFERVQTFLIHLVYDGPTEVTVRSVGHCQPEIVSYQEYSMVAVQCDDNDDGIAVGGNGSVNITDGGALSNSVSGGGTGISCGGNCGFTVDGCLTSRGDIQDEDGITSTSGCIEENQPTCTPDAMGNLPNPSEPSGACVNIDDPTYVTCTGCNNNGGVGDEQITVTDTTVKYCGWNQTNADSSVTFDGPGVFWIDGAVGANSGDLIVDHAMIFHENGAFSATGGVTNMVAMTEAEAAGLVANGSQELNWGGLVFFNSRNDPENQGPSFSGQALLTLTGTVYSPTSECGLTGQGGQSVTGQFICLTLDVTGNGDFEIIYNEDLFFEVPPQLQISS